MVGVYVFLSGAFLGAVLAGLMSDAWGVRTGAVAAVHPLGAHRRRAAGERRGAHPRRHRAGDGGARGGARRGRPGARARRRGPRAPGAEPRLLLRHRAGAVRRRPRRAPRRGARAARHQRRRASPPCCAASAASACRAAASCGCTGTPSPTPSPRPGCGSGVVMMPGGNALWDPLTVEENLRLGAFLLRNDDDERQRRLDRVLELFPELRERLGQPAGTLSGGQKQMVALAKAHAARARGAAHRRAVARACRRIAAQQVLAKVEQLRDQGLTIVIVEQSVNVALSIADRAVFMEKGQVRFDGPAGELLERGDLLRAVFLGGDGGPTPAAVATRDAARASSPSLGVDLNPQDLFDGAVTGLVYGFLGHRRDPAVPGQRHRQLRLRRDRVARRGARGQDGHRLELAVRPRARSSAWPRRRGRPCAIEMTVVRRLFDSARITLFVATIGVAQLVTVLVINVPAGRGLRRHVPDPVQRHAGSSATRSRCTRRRSWRSWRSRWWRSRSAGSSTEPSGGSPSPPRRPTPTPAAWPG